MRELDIATYVATFAHVVTPVPLQDDEAVPNLQLSPSLLQLRTLADITPPVWSTGSPAITSVTDKSGLLSVELDEPGGKHNGEVDGERSLHQSLWHFYLGPGNFKAVNIGGISK